MTSHSVKNFLSEHVKKFPIPFQSFFFPQTKAIVVDHTPVKIGLYEAHQLEGNIWPKNAAGEYARCFLTPLMKKGVNRYIENVETDLRVLILDEIALPITINDSQYDNSYVCSPYSYYISYARESIKSLTSPGVYKALSALLWGASKILRACKVNKVITVNNWLYSTNLYPPLQPRQLAFIKDYLHRLFPEHAIVFRSIDPCMSATCYETLDQIGFSYIASRQIFCVNPRQSTLFESRLFKSDLKLLHTSGYEIIGGEQLQKENIAHLLELYRNVYIYKYSDLNPQFNEDFLRLMLAENLMEFKALKKDGRIDGIVGYIKQSGKMFCPFFGYDRKVPKEVALYRLLSTILMLEADRENLFFHLSAGASAFKKMRKAESYMEYIAVYDQHLKWPRRMPWILLKKMCNSFGVNFMKKY